MSPQICDSEEEIEGELVVQPRKSDRRSIIRPKIRFDPSNVAFVELQKCEDFYYHVLARKEQKKLFDDLEKEYSYSLAMKRVFERIKSWKETSGESPAESHEVAVRQALGIHREPRSIEDTRDDIRENEPLVIEHIHKISDAYIQTHFGEQITVYRGLTHKPESVAAKVIDNIDHDEYELETAVLDNYSISRRLAVEYYPLIVIQELSPDDIAVATDFLLWPKMTEDRDTDGEVQVRGDRVNRVSAEGLKIVGYDGQEKTLVKLFDQLDSIDHNGFMNKDDIDGLVPVLDEFEHDLVAGLVKKMYKQNHSIYTDSGQSVLETWCRLLTARKNRGELPGLFKEYDLEFLHIAVEEITDRNINNYHPKGGRKGVEP